MKKAVITGITGLRNRGVEAMVVTTIEQLRQRQSNLEIDILTETIDYDEIRLKPYEVKLSSDDYLLLYRTQPLLAKLSKFSQRLAPTYKNINNLVRDASVVIASGGDVFSSDYGTRFLRQQLQPLEFALEAGVPVAFLAQSIGPFKKDSEAEMWLNVARRSKLITIREHLSYKYVTKDLGLSPELVKHTADPAFLLPPTSPEIVNNLFKSYGITKDLPVVALGISQGICRYTRTDYDKHIKVWCETIDLILNEFGAQVLIIPHVHDHRAGNDDRILAAHLLRLFNFDPRVHLAGADHTASEFKGLIAACDLVIAERMHAAIAGLSSGVCTLPIGYSVKAEGIMTDLLGSELVHEGLLISVEQFLDSEIAHKSIRFAWQNRHEVADKLKQVLPEVKQKTANNFDLLLSVVG
ncbi:polysaccharide pyruvyl transferase family protein [Nostoc spongiaeforme FACHB-130]|uniref:Polysaccharide pyruvyl transferase family protein n=1 Tax=Nostoc spongiaeforme FACHB-130 TaxID=1357510 RepID=A0ABR8FXI2_9NOSO|nr:polysaccharide pyruvyl transferase family protein [Nostoc spongiaeforme]MBD2594943.1 polysaccharide pyruvyl transferase family protein [Nostoc spongiaeforme FACHB-130]